MKYKIVWTNKTTGEQGEGEPDEDYPMLIRVAKEMDYTFPECTHVVYPVKHWSDGNAAIAAAKGEAS